MRGFKKLRKQNNWTQPQLATKANVSSQVVSNWERGYTRPSPDDIAKLSEIFDVRSDFILLGKLDSPLPSNKGTSFSRPKILDALVELTPEELTVFQELKKYTVFFNDLASDPSKIKKVIKMWEFMKSEIENDNDEEPED